MGTATFMNDGPDAPFYEERRCPKCAALLVIVVASEITETWACQCCDQAPTTCPHRAADVSQ